MTIQDAMAMAQLQQYWFANQLCAQRQTAAKHILAMAGLTVATTMFTATAVKTCCNGLDDDGNSDVCCNKHLRVLFLQWLGRGGTNDNGHKGGDGRSW